MTAANIFYPLVGLLVLAVPGLALQLAAGVRDKLWLAALTPSASIGVFVLAGVVSGIPGISYGPALVVAVTVVLAAVLGFFGWRQRRRPVPEPGPGGDEPVPPAWLPALSPRLALAAKAAAVLLVLAGLVLAFQPWRTGLGSWDTYPQEHDTIIHTVLVAYIARTGHAAPWELLPLDVLTGQPVAFYPSGLPLTGSLAGELTGGPIPGFNVVNALCAGPAFVLGCAALTAAVLRRLRAGAEWTALAGGIAAVVAAGLYRPGVNLLHDGGIAPNAVAMSLAPGMIAVILTIGRRQWLRAVVLGIGVAGIFSVHPSVFATVGASVLVFWIAEAFSRSGRRELRGQWPMLVLAAVVSGIAAFGQMLGSAGQATRTGSWLPDIGAATLGDAVGTNVTLTYGGYYDSKQMYAQLAAAVLALLGAGAVLAARRGWGAAAMWLFWLAVSIDFKVNPANGIASTFIGSFFYKSYVRVQAHISLFVPTLGAIGVLFTAAGLAHVLANHRQLAKLPFLRSPGPVAVVLAVLAVLAYVPTASVAYEHRNAEVIASRYLTPEFTRVDAHDRQAADWLRERIRPGERVMNSANDGSTAAYVEDGVPVVNVVTLGAIQAPYTFALLKSFRDYPDDPVIRKELLDLNVSYVYVDTAAPMMGAGPGAPDNWLGEPAFTQAPGLKNLDGLPGLSAGFRAGTVTVYTLDRRVLAGLRG